MTSGATVDIAFVRWLGLAVAATGSALVLVFFSFVDLGGTISGTFHPWSLVAAAFWSGPFWVYAGLVRTRAGALIGALALLAASTGFLVALFRDTHSTAGIGVFTIPMLLYPLAAAVLVVDRLIFALRSGEEPVLGWLGRGILATALSFVVVVAAVMAIFGIVHLVDPVTPEQLAPLPSQLPREAEGEGGHLAFSLIRTTASAVIAIGGGVAIRHLWRPPRASSRRIRAKS